MVKFAILSKLTKLYRK